MNMHPYDEIEAFALGGLEIGEASRVLEHAESCPTCGILLAEAMRTVTALEPSDERVPTPMMSVGARVYSRPPTRTYAWVASVAAAAAIALFAWNLDLRSHSLPLPIASLVHSHFEHHALRGAPGAGSAKVIQALDGSWLYLVADGLKPNTQYVLKEVVAGSERDVGSFHSNDTGQAAAYWSQPTAKIQEFSIEPQGQSQAAGSGLRWP